MDWHPFTAIELIKQLKLFGTNFAYLNNKTLLKGDGVMRSRVIMTMVALLVFSLTASAAMADIIRKDKTVRRQYENVDSSLLNDNFSVFITNRHTGLHNLR
jgi:hypothetical protein